jgi:Poly(R)-hydroxyalkanoic acid synthase subunit (PHA_synth_III_E)
MPTTVKHETSRTLFGESSSFLPLLSGWAQQGVQSFFATQRILVDMAMRQNASVIHSVRQQLTDPKHSPTAILSEATAEGVSNFIEAQKILLELGQKQNEIVMTGVKERVGECPRRQAAVDLLKRSIETFVNMQQEFLKIAGKQTHTWAEATKTGKAYDSKQLVEAAREAMDHFVKTQKHFMDVITEETAKVTGSKHTNGVKKTKRTEVSQLAREATESFIDAQKKLVDVAGRQMNADVKTAGKTVELLRPLPFLPLAELAREGVKSYVDAQKELINVVTKPGAEHKHAPKAAHRAKQSPKRHAHAHAAAASA